MPTQNNNNSVEKENIKNSDSSSNAREAILDAALTEFSTFGFQATSVRTIGKRAKVDFTLITYYFKTKENLWKSVVSRAVEKYQENINNKVNNLEIASPGNKLRARLRGEFEFAHSGDSLFNLAMNEIRTKSARSHWLFDNFIAKSQISLVEMIEEGQASGEIAEGDPIILCRVMQTSLRSLLLYDDHLERFNGTTVNTEPAKEELWRLFDKIFFTNLQTKSE